MSDPEKENIVDETTADRHLQPVPNRKPLYITVGVIAVMVIGIFALWMFRNRESGQVVMPPRNVTFGDNGTGGVTGDEVITIPPDQIDRMGLKLEPAGETLSSEASTLAATGVVQPNSYKEMPVISLLGGVVRSVSAELGQYVRKGQTLAVIFSDELAASQSRYLSLQTEAQTARQNYDRAARLVKISPSSNAELDQALAALKIAEVELEEHHKHHMRASRLLEIGAASREEYEDATTKLKTAEANVTEAQSRYSRAVKVAEINPVSRGEFEQAAVKRQTAESDLAAARERLLLFGLPPQRVNSLRSPSQITSQAALPAPVTGTITKRDVNAGETVEANKELMRVTDLATVWVIAQVYEKDLAMLHEGSGASVTTDAYTSRLFRGHVTYIDPNINQETRTAQVRVELDNPGQALKIGMYVNVAFGSMGTAERTLPVVPSSAIQTVNNDQVVFVATDQPNAFALRRIHAGQEHNGKTLVLDGINVGDKVVTDGSFLLRAEILKRGQTN